jgi:hypothetical protein
MTNIQNSSVVLVICTYEDMMVFLSALYVLGGLIFRW